MSRFIPYGLTLGLIPVVLILSVAVSGHFLWFFLILAPWRTLARRTYCRPNTA